MIAAAGFGVTIGARVLLSGLDLRTRPGVPLAIVGESGAGKSTLALALLGLAPGTLQGSLRVGGADLAQAGARAAEGALRGWRGRHAGLVPQDVHDALHPQRTLREQVAHALRTHGGLARTAAFAEAAGLLAGFGLDAHVQARYPAQCSGGQLQRALLALALAPGPRLLVLDEPTSALDPAGRALVLDRLRLEAERRQLVLVTHDLDLARAMDGDVLMLYGGCAVEHGPARRVLGAPRHPYTRGLLRAWPRAGGKDLQGIAGEYAPHAHGCAFANRCSQRIARCASERPALDAGGVACLRGGIVDVLAARDLHLRLGGRPVLAGASLAIQAGETVAVVGASGAGKSTLARILVGLQRPERGAVERLGAVAYVPQDAAGSIAPHFSVFDAVAEPLRLAGVAAAACRVAVDAALAAVQLPAAAQDAFGARAARTLSGGEAQRVALARALVGNPALLVADEPTAALDASVQAKVLRLLLDLQTARGLALLLITHDLRIARHVADRVLVLRDGRCIDANIDASAGAGP